jgi:predicted nicotinamide N-methyase
MPAVFQKKIMQEVIGLENHVIYLSCGSNTTFSSYNMPEPLVFSIPFHEDKEAPLDSSRTLLLSSSSSSSLQIKLHQAHDGIEKDDDDDNQEVSPVSTIEGSEAMHDTGLVMWPSSVMLARYLTQHPFIVWDCPGNILELGAGCGLVGLTVARLLQRNVDNNRNRMDVSGDIPQTSTVIMTDYNQAARDNLKRNIRLNNVDDYTSVTGLDFFDQINVEHGNDVGNDTVYCSSTWMDMDGHSQPQVPLIVAADILAYSNDANMVANTLQVALMEGGQAFILGPEECYRFGVEGFSDACESVGLEVSESNISAIDTFHQQDRLLRDIEQTGGFKEKSGYDFTMFQIVKPCKRNTKDADVSTREQL